MTSKSDTTSFPPHGSADAKMSVVVIGAGYAGVLATNRFLASLRDEERQDVRLTVINSRAEFVERIRLHELAAGSRTAVTSPLSEILHREARRVVGTVTAIDAKAQTATTQTATGLITQRYDYLIYAPGSAASSPVPGAREHAHLIADLEGAQSAARAVSDAAPGTRVVVIGGGFTGVETATEVADHRPDLKVTLLSNGPILAHMRPAARRSILRTGNHLGIRFVQDAAVQSITAGALRLHEGESVDFDVCLVALSFTAPALARVSGLAVDRANRLRVDETLCSITAPNVIGAGDAVVTPPAVGSHLRMGCAVAMPLGGHAAETVLHLIRKEQPDPISIGLILQCLSLGRRRGYIQVVRADDSARNMALNGRLGAAVKEMVSRMVVTSPRKEREKPGAYRGVKGPRTGHGHVPVARARAGAVLAVGLLVVTGFQVALALGAPFGAAALGGTNPGQLPGPLRLLTAFFAGLWLIGALVVVARAGHAPFTIPKALYGTGTKVLVGLLGAGTLLNFASSSPWERFGWGPFTLVLFSLSVVLARSDRPGQPDAEPSRPDRTPPARAVATPVIEGDAMLAWTPTADPERPIEITYVDTPAPAPDEVVLRVEAFSVNRGETFLLESPRPGWGPGKDVAGTVVRVAADGSGPSRGQRVVGHPSSQGWAEEVAVSTDALAVLPPDIASTTAAALPLAGITALRLLRLLPPLPGLRMLLTGASGGVGHYLTELAVGGGAQVTVVVADPARGTRLAGFGAHVVASVHEAGAEFDVASELVGGESLPAVLGRARGRGLVIWFGQASRQPTTLDFFDLLDNTPSVSLRQFDYTDGPDFGRDLNTLVRLVEQGHLHPEIGRVDDWSQTRNVLADLRDRKIRGNAVLTLSVR